MIKCKLTGTFGKGVKAHIIPRAFYEISSQDEGPLRLLSNTEGAFPKKIPVGIYDNSIVTAEGEKHFDLWDDYAIKTLVDGWSGFQELKIGSKISAWSLPKYDYSKLKLFALSVLWRAHASSHPAFSRVVLGSHETAIRNILLSQNPGNPEEYSVIIARWLSHDFGPVFMDPLYEKYHGVNFYRIYCGRYILYVKADKRATIPEFKEMQLGHKKELFIIARELRESKEWPILKKIALSNSLKETT